MSGPPLPRPVPGSSAIGDFTIGISPIGTVIPFDVWTTVISQYANSDIITQLITSFEAAVDPTLNLNSFFELIWNVNTAVGYGLDVWGRIVGVSRVLNVPAGDYFGFNGPSGASGDPFGISPFFSGEPLTSNYALTDDAFRVLIFAKALSNITDGSISSINQVLLNLFPERGNCYVTDDGNMQMTYTFEFTLTPVEQAILGQTGVLPTPVGVSAAIVHL